MRLEELVQKRKELRQKVLRGDPIARAALTAVENAIKAEIAHQEVMEKLQKIGHLTASQEVRYETPAS